MLMIQTGVRVTELTGLHVTDVHLGTGPHIRVTGKGRKKRATTLTGETVKVVLPLMPFSVAEMVEVPAALPVATPAVVIVAVDVLDDAQVTCKVRFCVLESE